MTDESIDPIETLRRFIGNAEGSRMYMLSMGEAKAIIATVERLQNPPGLKLKPLNKPTVGDGVALTNAVSGMYCPVTKLAELFAHVDVGNVNKNYDVLCPEYLLVLAVDEIEKFRPSKGIGVNRMTQPKADILDRLKAWASHKVGDQINAWGPPLTEVLNDAIKEIERLRRIAGAVSDGQSFADLKKLKGVQDT